MSLIKCPECGQDVSDKAENCIHCGYPIKQYLESNKIQNLKENQICNINHNPVDFLTSRRILKNLVILT